MTVELTLSVREPLTAPAVRTVPPLMVAVLAELPSALSEFTAKTLLPNSDLLWAKPIPEEPFARFHDWAEKFAAASPETRAGLEPEGIVLAKERREALAALIKSDPQRALDLAIPAEVRENLPLSISQLLEERVSGRGRLAVLGALPEPGKENEVPTDFRTATLGGREFQAFVYSRRLGESRL